LRQGDGEEVEVVEEEEEEPKVPDPDHMCNISLAYDSRTNIFMILSGYMMGLYESDNYPEDGCDRCKRTALPFS